MGLFDVPGWTVSAEPGAVGSREVGKKSKKRKREDGTGKNLTDMTKNVESLIRQLGDAEDGEPKSHWKERNKIKSVEGKGETSSPPKKKKARKSGLEQGERTAPQVGPSHAKQPTNVTPLQSKMKKSLEGAKFRVINEMLYKSGSAEAHRMMQEDPTVFDEYHVGFRSQSAAWPTNPVEHYITTLSRSQKGTVIADLGCGDAALARALLPKGLVVLSFDLVSKNPNGLVVEADICSRIPLPGSEVGMSEDADEGGNPTGQVVDICICSLSLMSTNWVGCVRECWRILKNGGLLHIAEVTSRLKDVKEFIEVIKAIGFKMTSKNTSNTHFMLFEFRKTCRDPISDDGWIKLIERGNVLQPCEYKRR